MEEEFSKLSTLLDAESAQREAISKEVRELNRIFRLLQFTSQKVHNACGDTQALQAICTSMHNYFLELHPVWRNIYQLIVNSSSPSATSSSSSSSPPSSSSSSSSASSDASNAVPVEKYRDMWRFALQNLCTLVAFYYFLLHSTEEKANKLISLEETQNLLGVGFHPAYQLPNHPLATPLTATPVATVTTVTTPASNSATVGIGLDVEDYLHGISIVPKELSRLCINAVRASNYTLPTTISTFLHDLYAGFRLLNLRNDGLRRKFDGIKYDIQKIEEVLYDVQVRKLNVSTTTGAGQTSIAEITERQRAAEELAKQQDENMQ